MPFDDSILTPDPVGRARIIPILAAALDSVDPFRATQSFLAVDANTLMVGSRTYDLSAYRRILVVGAGKAGAPMALAVEAALGDRIDDGLVVVKTGHVAPTQFVRLVEASHPMPDSAGVEAGRQILRLAESAGEDDLLIVLLSGGGSALLVSPASGLSLADLQRMTDALLASGATIDEINCLRKHCSAVKGGQLARRGAGNVGVTLALSDVVGSPLDVIASGPTVADQTTWTEAWAIVRRYDLADLLPAAVLARLKSGLEGKIADTPQAGDPIFSRGQVLVVADNRVAALAACEKATAIGTNAMLLTTYLEGEASQVAKVVVALGLELHAHHTPLVPPACLVLGGETTVSLGSQPGKGGRNQELALACALELHNTEGITIVSLATDGTDGPTDSAGGLVDGTTLDRGASVGLDAEDHLHRHDAYPYLAATHDLLLTGPTQTNVNDLIFVFVE